MRDQVVVYADASSPGLKYVLDFVFETWFGVGYRLVHEKDELRGDALLISYAAHRHDALIHIIPSADVFGSSRNYFDQVAVATWDDLPCFFNNGAGDVPFDLFGAIFFLLSRAEEYRDGPRDAHNRFLSAHSVFSGTEIIKRPIIDEWLTKFGTHISDHLPQFAPSPRAFKWLNTFDIDVAYAYKYRSAWRLLAGFAKDVSQGDFANLRSRLRVLFGVEPDPFDTYQLQFDLATAKTSDTIYFMLLGDFGKYDKNLSHRSSGVQGLIAKLARVGKVGIHPSYASNFQEGLLQEEMRRLEKITGVKVDLSRQHYLKVSFPSTYRNLIAAGITEDYSLGYSDMPGFRSGTCTPHRFFDFERQEATELKIYPLAVMDASLQDYMGLEPSEASDLLKALIARVKNVNGTFMSLWHNESLSETGPWRGWRNVYAEMARNAADAPE